jgi:hypothetical protein
VATRNGRWAGVQNRTEGSTAAFLDARVAGDGVIWGGDFSYIDGGEGEEISVYVDVVLAYGRGVYSMDGWMGRWDGEIKLNCG